MPDIFSLENKPNVSSPSPSKNVKDKPMVAKSKVSSQLFSSYSFMPSMRFDTQEPGETIILLLRRHWITNISWIIIGLLLILAPILFFPLVSLSALLPPFIPPNFITFIILIWYLLTGSFILTEYLLWYFNVSIVTQERIIDIDFALLYKSISETRISRVEDVTSRTGGFIRSFFDYGDVYVQTAANFENFEFLAVPHPQQVVKIINQLMGKEEG